MIVDDEAEVREGIVRRIDWKSLGFEIVAEAENGQDALEKAESLELDVVLTDIKMPFIDGLTVGTHLQRLHPSVKLIIFTGFDKFEYAKEAIKLNVIEYVLKPVNADELSQVLMRVKSSLDSELMQRRNIEMLTEVYKKSFPLMRDHFLSELLLGTVSEKEIESQLVHFNIPIQKAKNKVAVVFELDQKGAEAPAIDRELLPISLKQLVDDRLGEACHFASFISFSAVIAITAWDSDPIGNLMSIANKICADCSRIFKINVTAGIGKSYEDVRHIHESYMQGKTAVEYKLMLGNGKAIYIRDMELIERDPVVFDSRWEQRLVTVVKFGSKDQIISLVDSIIMELDGVNISEWRYQAYIMGILSALSQIVSRYDLDEYEIFGDREEWSVIPSRDFTQEKMKSWFADTCLRISGRISKKRISTAKSLVEEAKRYINEKYSCAHLSVDMICDHLHISPSYFSTIFKIETGQSYLQHLTNIRMERALTLLRETDDKTYMIAQKVGYDEPNYFSYVFKKRFGAAPSQYRK
jgi:two-component system response regulator YesN